MSTAAPARATVLLVTGLSGAGKLSILRALEDLGFEAIDNPPLALIDTLVSGAPADGGRRIAVGVDARSRGFDASAVLATLARLRQNPVVLPALVYAWAEPAVLQRRYTETRRRHPLSPHGRVADGIAAEQKLTAPLREAADLVIDTSALPLPELRLLIERHFGAGGEFASGAGLAVTVMSFAFPAGLPREADMVFDARFLRNPHYVDVLRPLTGRDPEVAAYVEADGDFPAFLDGVCRLLDLVLPRFVQEGKKYATIAFGCTGGQHRSVVTAEKVAAHLLQSGWRVGITHRELQTAAVSATMTEPSAGEGKAAAHAPARQQKA